MLRLGRRTASKYLRGYNSNKLQARTFIEGNSAVGDTISRRSPLAFAFDIDGVLLRGPQVLPEARRALHFLDGNNPLNTKIPHILMTNGGGITESERSKKLSRQLGREIRPSQLVQAHTVLRRLKHKYADKPVLVLGGRGNKGREVVESYGFTEVYISLDLLAWDPSIWPFHWLTDTEKAITKQEDFSKIAFEAVIVIHDPLDWALDIQVMSDVLRSRTKICRDTWKANDQLGERSTDAVELIFCNPDLLWRSDYPVSRYGQGAFKEAFQAVFKSVTGTTYPHTQYGKPHKPTYDFSKDVLKARITELEGDTAPEVPHIFMVGDNPASDIAGANGASWKSILVHTGVYDPAEGPPEHTPTAQAKDVEQAVRWAFREVTGL